MSSLGPRWGVGAGRVARLAVGSEGVAPLAGAEGPQCLTERRWGEWGGCESLARCILKTHSGGRAGMNMGNLF